MAEWNVKYPVEYSAASDETIDSWFQDYIAEINRIYQLLNRVRRNDSKAGEPDDTTPYQFHVDNVTDTLYMRNPADTAWIPIGKLSADKNRFVFDRAIANNGGVTSLQIGKLADRPAAEVDNAIYIAMDATATSGRRYRYSAALSQWVEMSIVLYADAAGKSHVQEADHAIAADESKHATAATNATYAATTGTAEYSATTGKLKTPISINGVPFDGSQSIHIEAGGSGGENSYESLLWRTEQNEREISNIELSLEDNSIFPDYNNLLVENFQSTVDVDQTAILVTSSAAGDDSLNVSSLYGVKIGALYMMTNGTVSEYVTVKGIVKNGSTYRVVLNSPVTNVYADNTAYLYRTTSKVGGGKATGSGVTSSISWNPSIAWSGEGTSTPTTTKLNTTTDNATSFTSDDGITYTSDGLVTIVPYVAAGISLYSTGNRVGVWNRVNADGGDL